MRNLIRGLAISTFLLYVSVPAWADLLPPGDHGQARTTMNILRDPRAREAQLEIPRSLLQRLQAEGVTDNPQNPTGPGRFLTLTGTQTAVAGVLMSLALVLGGLWFVRSRKSMGPGGRTAVAVAMLVLAGAAGSIVQANIGAPPAVTRSLTSAILVPEARSWGVQGNVKVILVDNVNAVTLILPEKK